MITSSEPLRIFLVENHPDTLKWLKLYLEGLHHVVVVARNMKEALELFPQADCHVLISDIGLPDGTGWELLTELKKSHSIFAIAMSGFGKNADSQRSLEAGFRYHVLKPFKPGDLNLYLQEAERELKAA